MQGNNIIFLDVDGVLNWDGSKSYCGYYLGIDTVRVRRLARIVQATDARIVLTSTWKKFFVVGAYKQEDKIAKYLSNKLRSQGLKIYDKISNDFTWAERGYAIIDWIKKHKVKNWVILDDESFFGYTDPRIEEHLIQTVDNWDDESSGLSEYLTHAAIDILQGKRKGPVMDKKFLTEWKR